MRIFEPANKVIANFDKVDDLLKGKNPSPVLVEIDPSNICNHACDFCSSSYIHFSEYKNKNTYDSSILSFEMLKKVFLEMDNMGVRAVTFTGGGDPTVNPKLKEIIQYVSDNTNLKMGLYTNGVLLERFDLYETIVNNVSWCRISVDAGNEKDYSIIRKTNLSDWKIMLYNVKKLIDIKNKFNSNIVLGVGFVITESTVDQIIGYAETFSNFCLDYCQYKTDCVNLQRWEEGYDRDFSLFDKIKEDLDVAKNILGNKFQCKIEGMDDILKGAEHSNYYKKCFGSQLQPCIGADGNVYVCPQLRGYKEYTYGNLYEKSFKEIWDDIGIREYKMYQIEEIDCFSNCTQLCKPHLSNKKIWEIYENDLDYFSEMEQNRKGISNWEFI